MNSPNIDAIYRLTPLQEGLLFHALEDPDSSAYFDQYCAIMKGSIDHDIMRQAWQGLAAHHAVLRTFFTWEKREHPLQVVRASVELPFDTGDLRGQDEQAQKLALERYLSDDRERGFVLDQAPLTRVRLTRLDDHSSHLAWSFHHLILDGWSVRLLLRELQERYDALTRGERFEPPTAPTFEQFVSWQRQSDVSEATGFWRDYLKGFRTPSTPRVSAKSERPESGVALQQRTRLSADLQARLTAFARDSRVTLNTLFVAAWGLVLARYCNTDDVVFGATAAGRPADIPGVEGTAGLFITTLPIRVNTAAGGTAGELLSRLQKDQVRQRDNDFVGLNVIQKLSDVPAGMPLFETIVVFENFPSFARSASPGFVLEREDFREFSHYPLALLVVPGETIDLIAVHRPERYPAEDVGRMMENLVTALTELVTKRDIGTLDVLSRPQRDALFDAGRGAERPLRVASVLEEFARQVEQTPGATAVAVGEAEYTYADIDLRAHRLARKLRSEQLRNAPGVVIVCERNEWAIAGMLGAMMAGKVYVTLDVKDPASRIDYVLRDVAEAFGGAHDAVPVLLTTGAVYQSSETPKEQHTLMLIDKLPADSEAGGMYDTAPNDPDTPAYVIYTSGSTGRPKGVLVSHGSLANSTLARSEYYPEPPDAFALLSSLATDSSIAGIFWTLCSGGALVMPAERAELDVTAMLELFDRCRVTHTLCVPSLYALMLDVIDSTPCRSLRTVILAGEACPLSLVKRHYGTLSDVALYNEYGPSEACVWVTAARLLPDDTTVSIGGPIMNTQTVVLDDAQRLTPLGVPGELYVGGLNVAREYINQPEATASSFVTLSMPDAQRFYRTGDKVVLNANRQLEYLGRVDTQLKIRGFRVEPGEVEAALCIDERVEAAIVLVDESDLDAAVSETLDAATGQHIAFIDQALNAVEQMSDEELERALNTLANVAEVPAND